jgi:hypothetical protein
VFGFGRIATVRLHADTQDRGKMRQAGSQPAPGRRIGFPLSRRPRHGAAAEQVQVDVKYRLSGISVRVEDRPKPTGCEPAVLRDGGPATDQLAEDLIVLDANLVQRGDMSFRNHQDVRRRLWVDVVERQHTLIFVDDRRGDLVVGNPAKEAISHRLVSRLKRRDQWHARFATNTRDRGSRCGLAPDSLVVGRVAPAARQLSI